MARIKGGGRRPHPPLIRSTDPSEWIPLTASERRRRVAVGADKIQEQDQEVQEHSEVVPRPDFAAADNAPRPSFVGGPEDLLILTAFANHVATRLWLREDRGELKVATGGRKLKMCESPHHQIEGRVVTSWLAPLLSSFYSEVDKGILSAFVERWHSETSSFHPPVGEMTITLDDVSSLLHPPIRGSFWNHPCLDKDWAVIDLVSLLGMPLSSAMPKVFQICKAPHVRLEWLREVYTTRSEDKMWDEAARAFLFHLVGCTIFADKSATSVDVSYWDLFRNLPSCGGYAWGAFALAYLYDHLHYGCQYQAKQLGGYMTLFQVRQQLNLCYFCI